MDRRLGWRCIRLRCAFRRSAHRCGIVCRRDHFWNDCGVTADRPFRSVRFSGATCQRVASGRRDGADLSSISLRMAQARPDPVSLSGAFLELLQERQKRLPWPSDVAVPSGLKMHVVDSNRPAYGHVWRSSVIGEHVDMLESRMGRAFLAYLPTKASRRLIDRLLARSYGMLSRRTRVAAQSAPRQGTVGMATIRHRVDAQYHAIPAQALLRFGRRGVAGCAGCGGAARGERAW